MTSNPNRAVLDEPITEPVEIPEEDLALDELTPRPRRSRKFLIAGLGVLALVAVGVLGWRLMAKPAKATYNTVEVRRTDLSKTITATGKLQPVTTVQVGTQVSGTVSELHADFNDRVTAGQLIARLDPSQIEAQLTQAKASLSSAESRAAAAQSGIMASDAAVQAAQANLDRVESAVADAQRNHDRVKKMLAEGVSSARDYETAQASLAQAGAQKQQALAQLNQSKAQAQSSRAQLAQAQAEVQQSRASVAVVQVNLERTVIRAPINGVVVSRNVDIGQTVAASLQAPTLFLIANDLTRMQVLADIDEADVGQLRPESKVTFTVDAFPNDTFEGRIKEVRLSPQTVQNVTTYTAVIEVANPELKLRPGMTANVTASVEERHNVLTVPNTALRYRPENFDPSKRPAQSPSATAPNRQRTGGAQGGGVIWTVQPEGLKPTRVRLGMSDGVSTEIVAGELKEGDRIAVPVQQANSRPQPGQSMLPVGGGMRGVRR